eukprot:CAMPEP_0203833836 /NCGR_PEP_ID=MMETSP0115-20131106/72857_1 /ASSEMBLY_ACC=CAM_ASM_000227 /TAXON_ID=33651 /ORGANISM="Bicosoecid sp, Strain ms1" /LENGTH=156 /DNA_ID=CAMNT_0050742909 /DNA_START=976 /DNA_END=1447 /DNA_ORIENTATION=+
MSSHAQNFGAGNLGISLSLYDSSSGRTATRHDAARETTSRVDSRVNSAARASISSDLQVVCKKDGPPGTAGKQQGAARVGGRPTRKTSARGTWGSPSACTTVAQVVQLRATMSHVKPRRGSIRGSTRCAASLRRRRYRHRPCWHHPSPAAENSQDE